MVSESKKISFDNEEGRDFHTVLKQRVNQYFKEHNISPKANFFMNFKAIFLMSLFFLTYSFFLTFSTGGVGVIGFFILLGVSISIGTMNFAHDALHGAYFSHPFGNRVLGLFMDLCGASSYYWKKEHTVDHHTYTNIAEHDADLDVPIVLRLCPKAPYRPYHRFQQWYAPFLYCLNLLHWIYFSDPKRIYRIYKNKSTNTVRPSNWEIFYLFFFKFVHVAAFLVIPSIFLPVPFWQVLTGYLCMVFTMGLTLTVIFQLAHIVENVAFPLPNAEGKIENSFLYHQLATTSNFAMNSKLVSFLFGGLNFQVEHHIFPHICHIHLSKIAPIVQATTKEFGLPYHANPSFFAALRSHFRTLKKLGRAAQESSNTAVQDFIS